MNEDERQQMFDYAALGREVDSFWSSRIGEYLLKRSDNEYVEAMRRLMDSDFMGPVNIGSEEMVTINQLARMTMKVAGKELAIRNIPGPVGVRGRNSDNALIRAKLGWAPSQPLVQGLSHSYKWIAQQAAAVPA